jgi:dolichol-phosphate mannosyltransferase
VYAGLYLVGSPPPGITTLIILAFLGIGINSLGLGILGEYLGRTYWEVKGRPLYIVRESVNLPSAGSARSGPAT